MKSIEESVVTAMDGTDKELFPFLPYILQDTWEIGADPDVIVSLISKHCTDLSSLKVLDLGCGKGVVSVKVAQKLKCSCFGIDAITEFIDYADKKAMEYQVDHLCRFEVNDIRERVKTLPVFDVIILGAIGPVLGDYYSTLSILLKCLEINGIVIIDDGYIENNSEYSHPRIQRQEELYQQIKASGMKITDESVFDRDDIKNSDDSIFDCLKKRCIELMELHPDKRQLFDNYIKNQEQENDVLENKVICSTMVLTRII
jgi:protein-L-isoaspartate O-methyltransferase